MRDQSLGSTIIRERISRWSALQKYVQ